MPQLDGAAVFGPSPAVEIEPEPRAWSPNRTFGDSGDGGTDGGSRGVKFTVTGQLRAAGPQGLAAAQWDLRRFNDGAGHTFLDPLGLSWFPTLLESFEPVKRARQDPAGNWSQSYRCTLLYIGA